MITSYQRAIWRAVADANGLWLKTVREAEERLESDKDSIVEKFERRDLIGALTEISIDFFRLVVAGFDISDMSDDYISEMLHDLKDKEIVVSQSLIDRGIDSIPTLCEMIAVNFVENPSYEESIKGIKLDLFADTGDIGSYFDSYGRVIYMCLKDETARNAAPELARQVVERIIALCSDLLERGSDEIKEVIPDDFEDDLESIRKTLDIDSTETLQLCGLAMSVVLATTNIGISGLGFDDIESFDELFDSYMTTVASRNVRYSRYTPDRLESARGLVQRISDRHKDSDNGE